MPARTARKPAANPAAPTRQPAAQHNIPAAGPALLDMPPTIRLPNGVGPRKARLYRLMMRPRLSSGTRVCTMVLHETTVSIMFIPTSIIRASDRAKLRENANAARLAAATRQVSTIRLGEPRTLDRVAR